MNIIKVIPFNLGIIFEDTHPMDGFDEECVKKEFSISADKIIPMLIAVGNLKSGMTLLTRAFRRGTGEFVSFEAF